MGTFWLLATAREELGKWKSVQRVSGRWQRSKTRRNKPEKKNAAYDAHPSANMKALRAASAFDFIE